MTIWLRLMKKEKQPTLSLFILIELKRSEDIFRICFNEKRTLFLCVNCVHYYMASLIAEM